MSGHDEMSIDVPASLCSMQLELGANQIGDAGATELAKALAANHTLTLVRMTWRGACTIGRGEGHTLTLDAMPIASRCACPDLLGAALSL